LRRLFDDSATKRPFRVPMQRITRSNMSTS
jgi:hypothetical protein